jgi:hypothetical protein
MAENRFDLELGLDFSKVTEALQQIKSQFTGTSAEFQKIANKFKDSFNTMTNAIKLYGKDSSQAQAATKSMERAMVELTKNGIDPASVGFKQLQSQIGPLASKMNEAGSSVKKSNMQYTNLALVLQDLPYGFRGIQNNLPALIGGMAGMTGAFYLAASAAIALYTAYDMGAFKSKEATEKAKEKTEALKKEKDAIDAVYNSTASETVEVTSLIAVLKSETETRNRKLDALVQLKKISPEIFDSLTLEKNAVIGLDAAYESYIKNLGTIIAVKIKQAELESIIEKRLKAEGVTLSQEEKDIKATGEALNKAITSKRTEAEQRQKNTKAIIKETKSQVEINKLKEQEGKILLNLQQLSSGIKVQNGDTKTGKTPEELAKERARLMKIANDAETKAYIGTLDERGQKEYNAGLELAENLEKMRAAGYTDSTTYYAEYRQNMLNIAKHYDDIEYKRNQDSIQANIDFETKIYNDSNRVWDQIQKEKLAAQIAFAKRQTSSIETELSVQDKLNRNSLRLRIEDTKQALAKLAVLAAFTFDPKVLGVYLDAIDKMTAKLKGLGTTWEETTKAIDSIIKSFINDSLFALGDSIGKALMGENVDALDAFGNLLADAIQALGKQLIAYGTVKLAALKALETTTPMGALLAIAAGIAAVAAGAALKSSLNQSGKGGINSGSSSNAPRKFANGGIISGPTMGLMGEYPGARANPEVVAPLDKLKDMIGGGGGGTFMLRGQDLLLSVNRAQKASNLKGQNISLV